MSPRIATTLDALPERAALAVGTFDGVHLGHQKLLAAMLEVAQATHRTPCVLTFSNSPAAFFRPETAPGRIMDNATLLARLSDLLPEGILLNLPFDAAFAQRSAADFIAALKGATVFCGEDWRFGKAAEGRPSDLPDVHIVPYAELNGTRVSSTRIRAAMARGAMDDVAALLGRPWSFTGTVVHGRGLAGTTFGVPTLNIPYPAERAPLARGVYKAQAELCGRKTTALLNFGIAPSIKGEASPLFEAHLLDMDGDFYGAEVTLTLDRPLLRAEEKFATLDALTAQILRDLARVRSDEA